MPPDGPSSLRPVVRTKSMTFNATLWWRRIEAIPPAQFILGSVAAVLGVGVVDHFTGPILSLSIFYLVPVAATAWIVGRTAAQVLAVFAATVWAVADRIGPLAEPKAPIAYANDVSMLLLFLFMAALLSALRGEVQRQRDLVQDVQRRLLPALLPRLPGVEVASRWVPAWTVAGDYYDLTSAGEGRVAICLADVSGKGMPAALIMSNVQATVRVLAAEGLPPDRVLATLNRFLYERLRRGAFVTMFYGVVDVERGTFAYASAGHNAAILRRRDGSLQRLESTGPVAGVFETAGYRTVTVDARLADGLFIYSDGITEYENAHGEQFGEPRLLEVLGRVPASSAEQTCDAVVEALRQFGGNRPYLDDVTMLALVRSDPGVTEQAAAQQHEPVGTT